MGWAVSLKESNRSNFLSFSGNGSSGLSISEIFSVIPQRNLISPVRGLFYMDGVGTLRTIPSDSWGPRFYHHSESSYRCFSPRLGRALDRRAKCCPEAALFSGSIHRSWRSNSTISGVCYVPTKQEMVLVVEKRKYCPKFLEECPKHHESQDCSM